MHFYRKFLCYVLLALLIITINLGVSAQKNIPSPDDTTSYSIQVTTIKDKKYIGFLNMSGFYLIDARNKMVIFQSGDYFTWELKDFNGDGNKDIFLDKGGNTPERFDLLLYVSHNHFKQIEDFDKFPSPVHIKGTRFYYSYHKSGCADQNWDSDLFYIQGFKAVRLGNVSGNNCNNSGIKDGVYINKIKGEKKILIKTLPVNILAKFKNHKWGFIEHYWTTNYKNFL